MNKIFIDGRLTRDAEVKTSVKGKPFTKFSIAVNQWAPNDGEKTMFINVTYFKDFPIEKGTAVIIEGRIDISKWGDEGKTFTSILADRVTAIQYISRKKPEQAVATATVPKDDSDIPF